MLGLPAPGGGRGMHEPLLQLTVSSRVRSIVLLH